MDEDLAIEIGRRLHGPGWVAQDYVGTWCWFAMKPVICGNDNFWTVSDDDPNQETYEIGYDDWSKYWRESLREVT